MSTIEERIEDARYERVAKDIEIAYYEAAQAAAIDVCYRRHRMALDQRYAETGDVDARRLSLRHSPTLCPLAIKVERALVSAYGLAGPSGRREIGPFVALAFVDRTRARLGLEALP